MNSEASIRAADKPRREKWKEKKIGKEGREGIEGERNGEGGGERERKGNGEKVETRVSLCKPDPLFGLGYIDFERVDTVCIKF